MEVVLRVILLMCWFSAVGACPQGCICRGSQVFCNELNNFPQNLPSSTSALYLSKGNIASVRQEDLKDFSDELTEFMITETLLTEVQPNALDLAVNMVVLVITETELQDLPDAVFQNLHKLQKLSLKGNKFTAIRSNWFTSLTNLNVLDLSKNLLTSVPGEAFQPLSNLLYLGLTGNNIIEIPSETFNSLSALNILRLNKNSIKEIPSGCFDNLGNLSELSLQDNLITNLHGDLFSKIPSLQKLFLSHNQITSLPHGIFQNLPDLSQISLYENQLESLAPDVFGPMPLKELWLYDNKISRVEDDTFKNLTQLRLLVLSRNEINHVSVNAFRGLEQLGEVSLHTNLLRTLQDGTFQGLPKLVNISLEHNFIKSLPNGFLQGVSHLGQIDLRNNSFENLPQRTLESFSIVDEILLHPNPWKCDKDIAPFRNWLQENPSKANQTLIVCDMPTNLEGEIIALLTDETLMLSTTGQPAATTTIKTSNPQTPPIRKSTSLPAVKTTASSKTEEVTHSGHEEGETVTKNTSIILITIAVVTTVIVCMILVSCVSWRRNKTGRGDIRHRNKNSVL